MRVIVVGCGRVGSGLGVRLQQDGHAVAIIDKAANAFRRLPEGWGGQTVVGFGFDRDVLLEAGIQEANALAAVTSGDNSNILAARIARETFEVPHVVARIKSPTRAVIYQRLGIPTVATVSWAVDQVLRRLLPEEGVTAWTEPTGEIHMVEHLLPESFCGHSYAELTAGEDFKPVLVTRGGQCRLVGPATVGQEGDLVHFAVRTSAVGDLERRLAEAQGAWGDRRRGKRDGGVGASSGNAGRGDAGSGDAGSGDAGSGQSASTPASAPAGVGRGLGALRRGGGS